VDGASDKSQYRTKSEEYPQPHGHFDAVFANADAAETWFEENDPEDGVAF
jgi:hypothetical protein